jgi:predicted Rossmann fold flavoprotein
MRMARFDVIVIGAGAAGLMAAATAGQRGKSVLLLEHTDTIGAKILISGGGRCNFTNRDVRADRFLSANPHFAKSALARYTQHDFIAMVARYGIASYEKTLGQLFCEGAGAARKIVAMLLEECARGDVRIETVVETTSIAHDTGFRLTTSRGAAACASLIIATGGLSIPKLGATDFAYRVARQFDVTLTETAPALVPLRAGPSDVARFAALSGVSTPVRAWNDRAAFHEALLFTHRGLSGPAILQLSSYWRRGDTICVDLLPAAATNVLRTAKAQRPRAHLATVLAEHLPQRLAAMLCSDSRPLADWKDAELIAFEQNLRAWTITPAGDEGYAKAEVTRGGIDTDELDQRTLMAKRAPGLFFIGECVDVTGWLGGYNFQWAWSSGFCAGMAV